MSRRKTALSKFNASEKRATAKRLRAMAAPEDKALPELAPASSPYNEHGPRSTYVRYNYWAETLDDLPSRCGAHGEAAIAYVRYGAIRTWLMRLYPDYSPLTHSYRQAEDAARLVGDEDLYRLGCPTTNGKRRSSVLDGLNLDDRCQAIRTAMDTIADHERAGSPGLSGPALAKRCKDAQQFINAVTAMAQAEATSELQEPTQ